MVLEKFIKKGRAWLYVPLRWTGFRKFSILLLTRLFYLMVPGLVFWTLWIWIPQWRLELHGALTLGFAIGFAYYTRILLYRRFKQQVDAYFSTRKKIFRQYAKMSEQEVDNLTSFQHQSILREADKKGILTRTIIQQSRKAQQERQSS